MKKIIETEVMTFEELDEKAKEKARNWWREGQFDSDWRDFIYEDAERAGLKITGFDVDSASFVRNVSGHFMIGISAKDCAERIVKDHGESCKTYKLAREYLDGLEEENDIEERDNQFHSDILDAYGKMLQEEIEERDSDKYIDEIILINKYTFTADGKRFG